MARYTLNANEYTGWIDIEINQSQDTVTGRMEFNFTPDGDTIEQSADIDRGTLEPSWSAGYIVDFYRGPGEDAQHYRGWVSEGHQVIGGYFTKDAVGERWELPWIATREE